jgi:hypothetical protein
MIIIELCRSAGPPVSSDLNMQKTCDPYGSSLIGDLSTTSATVIPINTTTISDADRLIQHLEQFERLITCNPDGDPIAVHMHSNILEKNPVEGMKRLTL